ncbi:hypothetical protein AOL_s00173g5 [Orbilia oligospora ATCC 24927]|uniref:Uncharacterized protein n=1 Tax=Arthrobotrys oligospora (strain ATCC 24927 / CBS 115.81 / DSM 1491) TaxID=756982 RepID=G1XNI7_ARTOA|nr:hypothetical protein AOL_s00173g5 [Orbilia oligospora ATCC 24927]EGX44904.1 hypothetical protein AOL_s00173g5 [Orbilia oligospora ATCC 24927]
MQQAADSLLPCLFKPIRARVFKSFLQLIAPHYVLQKAWAQGGRKQIPLRWAAESSLDTHPITSPHCVYDYGLVIWRISTSVKPKDMEGYETMLKPENVGFQYKGLGNFGAIIYIQDIDNSGLAENAPVSILRDMLENPEFVWFKDPRDVAKLKEALDELLKEGATGHVEAMIELSILEEAQGVSLDADVMESFHDF